MEKLGGASMRVAFKMPPALGASAAFAAQTRRSTRNAQTQSLNLRLFIREPPLGEIVGIDQSLSRMVSRISNMSNHFLMRPLVVQRQIVMIIFSFDPSTPAS